MGKIIAITNQKGGVGKTTTTVNLAAGLGLLGKKVLVVDIDPQANATSGLNINKKSLRFTLYDCLIFKEEARDTIINTSFKNIDILPGDINLAAAEINLSSIKNREYQLKSTLLKIQDRYDFVLIDCPPSLGLITINALTAADTILVPIQCEYYALEGLSQLMSTLRRIKELYNPYLEIEGVLLTMYDSRLNLTLQVVEEIKKFFPKKLFKTPVKRTVRISEAPSFGKPIQYYDKTSNGSIAYNDIAKELLLKNA